MEEKREGIEDNQGKSGGNSDGNQRGECNDGNRGIEVHNGNLGGINRQESEERGCETVPVTWPSLPALRG